MVCNILGKIINCIQNDVPDFQIDIKLNPRQQHLPPTYLGGVWGEFNNLPRKNSLSEDSYGQKLNLQTDFYRQRSPTYHGAPLLSHSRKLDLTNDGRNDDSQNWASDSESTLSWLDQQRIKLRTKHSDRQAEDKEIHNRDRSGLREENYVPALERNCKNRTRQACQLVEELKSTQDKLFKSNIKTEQTETGVRHTFNSQSRERSLIGKTLTKEHIAKQAVLNKLHNNFKDNGVARDSEMRSATSPCFKNNAVASDSKVRSTMSPIIRNPSITSPAQLNGKCGEKSKELVKSIECEGGQCKTERNYFVSGMEQPPFTTHQTKYCFSMSKPQTSTARHIEGEARQKLVGQPLAVPPRGGSAGSRSTPVTPIRGPSSREAMKQSMSFDYGMPSPPSKQRGNFTSLFH